jgi:hypothetical protein
MIKLWLELPLFVTTKKYGTPAWKVLIEELILLSVIITLTCREDVYVGTGVFVVVFVPLSELFDPPQAVTIATIISRTIPKTTRFFTAFPSDLSPVNRDTNCW